jgi:hypothetical protein
MAWLSRKSKAVTQSPREHGAQCRCSKCMPVEVKQAEYATQQAHRAEYAGVRVVSTTLTHAAQRKGETVAYWATMAELVYTTRGK